MCWPDDFKWNTAVCFSLRVCWLSFDFQIGAALLMLTAPVVEFTLGECPRIWIWQDLSAHRLVCISCWNSQIYVGLIWFSADLLPVLSENLCWSSFDYTRDAPKLKFLAKAEAEQNETLGRRPKAEYRTRFFAFFSPWPILPFFSTIA